MAPSQPSSKAPPPGRRQRSRQTFPTAGLLLGPPDPFPKQATASMDTAIPNEGWDEAWRLLKVQNPLSLTRTSAHPAWSIPSFYGEITGFVGNCLSTVDPPGKGALESHICITRTSDRKLGWHSLWAIVPALVGKPLSARHTMDN